MGKNARSNPARSFVALWSVLVLFILTSASWAGVASYQLDAGTTVPAPVSYWLSGNATSVTIEIIDAATGSVVYTFPVLAGANATRGLHSSVVTWYGEANGGATAPQGSYRVRATVVSSMTGTALRPLWESCTADGTGSNGWRVYGIAMNTNPASPFYGRVYVGNYKNDNGKTKGVWEFNPDGSVIRVLPQPPDNGFGASGPWGLCVDADDHVYVSNRSDAQPYGGAGQAVWRYRWDATATPPQWVCDPTVRGTFTDRYLGCNNATGSALRMIDTYYSTGGSGVMSRLYSGLGDAPPSFAVVGGDKYTGDCFMQPAVDSAGTVFVAGVNWSPSIGALTQWDMSGNPINDPGNPGPIKNRNANITQATGLALTADESAMWLARQAAQTNHLDTDTSAFYKFPKSEAMTATKTSVDLAKYAWGTLYKTSQYPRFIAVDGQSNLAVVGVDGDIASPGSLFGLYAEPTGANTSEVRVGRNTIVWGNDYSPEFVSASATPATVSCGGSTVVDVSGSDINSIPSGYNDIGSCVLVCPALGFGVAGNPATGTAMTLLSGPDAQGRNIYRLSVGVSADTPTGPVTADIYLVDAHSGVPSGHGTVTITVTGGTITGTLTEGLSGRKAAGVTVRATKGGFFREAVTNAQGVYSIDVTPNAGYTVAPVINSYKNTIPTEYNLQSNWPADPGTSDWPKTTAVTNGGTSTVSGRVWPLAVTQATYDWAGHSYRSGGRTVCVAGTVLRQAADLAAVPSRKGLNGYYFLTDTLGGADHDTQQAVKVRVFARGLECERGDKLVVVGTFDPPVNYSQGVVTPTSAPAVLSHGNPLPDPRDASGYTNSNLYGNMIGGYYVMKAKAVARVGTYEEFYVLTGGDSPGIEFRIDMDNIATTGIPYPHVGDVFDIQGVLDEMSAWNLLRAFRVGEPSDVVPAGYVPDIGSAKKKPDNDDVILQSAQVTAMAGGGVAAESAYVEETNRTAAIRVHKSALPVDVGPGDMVTVQGKMATTAQGERFIEATTLRRNSSARPTDPLGMNNRDASSAKALGLFIKTWGKVKSIGPDYFTISDGGATPLKVTCGSLAKPDVGRYARVRGIVSKDASGAVLLMRNEQVDWAYGEATYQPTALPGAFKYPRDFLVLGPFQNAESIPGDPVEAQTFRMEHDFIYDATGSAFDESSVVSLAPRLGGAVGTKTWQRSQPGGDNASFTTVFPTGNTYCTFYAHLWIYSPITQDIAMRVGSSDSVKAFVNGMLVWQNQVDTAGRVETIGEDGVTYASLSEGMNSVLLKVEHTTGASGVDCQFVSIDNMGAAGWGGATPLGGLGYLLNPAP